jgi:hypothetical protein
VEDHHVDRPEVEAGQPAQPTGTNRSNPLDRQPRSQAFAWIGPQPAGAQRQAPPPLGARAGRVACPTTLFPDPHQRPHRTHSSTPPPPAAGNQTRPGKPRPAKREANKNRRPRPPGGHSEGNSTRSHPELGRENPQRRWYCVFRRGRAGRRQAVAAPHHRRGGRPLLPIRSADPSPGMDQVPGDGSNPGTAQVRGRGVRLSPGQPRAARRGANSTAAPDRVRGAALSRQTRHALARRSANRTPRHRGVASARGGAAR